MKDSSTHSRTWRYRSACPRTRCTARRNRRTCSFEQVRVSLRTLLAVLLALLPALALTHTAACDNNQTELRRLVLAGKIAEAIAAVEKQYPALLSDREHPVYLTATVLLYCQQFIELLRSSYLEKAIEFARTVLADLVDDPTALALIQVRISVSRWYRASELTHTHNQPVMGLLAYPQAVLSDESRCTVSHLLGSAQRERTADALNNAIRGTMSIVQRASFCLSTLLTQTRHIHRYSIQWQPRRVDAREKREADLRRS